MKFVAGRVAAGLPQNIEQSDLVSYGIFGLIDAIDKFDPARGFKFETYAISRIKGAIIDELRSIDWVPRSVRVEGPRDRAGVLEARERAAAHARGRGGRRRARHDRGASCTRSLVADLLRRRSSRSTSCSARGRPRRVARPLGDTIADRAHDPVAAFEVEEMQHVLADAINRMPDRERLVLTLYYYEGLTLAEIGDVLGVTESRVCQIHTKAIFQLRNLLREHDAE